jgi:hypothetical protein
LKHSLFSGYSLFSLAGIELFFCEFEKGFSSSPFLKEEGLKKLDQQTPPNFIN